MTSLVTQVPQRHFCSPEFSWGCLMKGPQFLEWREQQHSVANFCRDQKENPVSEVGEALASSGLSPEQQQKT